MGSNAPGGGGFTDRVRDVFSGMVRGGSFSEAIGKANANATAQLTADGLGIQNIRRGVLSVVVTGGANTTVEFATVGFAPLDNPVKGEIVLSGRPLFVAVQAVVQAGGGGGDCRLSATLRGAEITGVPNGIPGTYTASTLGLGVSGWWIVTAPAPGRATLELVADAATADATIYTDANTAAALFAVEL